MTVTEHPPTLGLPARAYADQAWLDQEVARLFERSWTLVAPAEALASSGDRITVQVGRLPLLVTREDDGSLRAEHELDHDPPTGSVDVWEGMVFVHPDPTAPPLADTLGGLPAGIGSYRPGALLEVAHDRIVGDFNWKLFVENHIDVYHLWYLHEGSLGAFDHTRFEHQRLGRNWVSYEPFKAVLPAGSGLDQGTVPIAHIAERDRQGIGAHMVFPNLLMASTAEFFATYAVYPLAPGRSVVDLRIRAEPEADGAALLSAARSFINEDVFACEGVQAAVGSSRFAVGALAQHHERPITEFHQHLLAALAEPT